MLAKSSALLLVLGLLPGCISPKPADDGGDDTGDSGDDSGGDNGGDTGSGATIFDINEGRIAIGESVTLDRVVVSSQNTFGDEGFFIQDPAGGANSGLYVWSYNGVADLYVEVGDEVSVTGSVTDYYGWLEFSIDGRDAVTVTGAADVPAPVDLGDGSGVDWNSYESVPVTLTGQTITGVNAYGTGSLDPSGILLDNGFVNLEYDCRGSFEEITGVVFYEYGEWSLNARSEDEAVGYAPAEVVDATVAEVQMGEVCGPVRLNDVVATTPSWEDDGEGYFFVQDAGGGEYSGITIYVKDDTVDVSTGDVLTIEGSATEFYDLTELRVDDVAGVSVTGSAEPTIDVLGAMPADWEPWEGCLVQIEAVTAECDDPADNYGQCLTDWSITLDSVFYDYPWTEGVSWESVTGPVFYAYETWLLLPRDAGDLVVAD